MYDARKCKNFNRARLKNRINTVSYWHVPVDNISSPVRQLTDGQEIVTGFKTRQCFFARPSTDGRTNSRTILFIRIMFLFFPAYLKNM